MPGVHKTRFSFDLKVDTGMSGHSSMMSDNLKAEIARELGVYDTVKTGGWGEVSSKNCGNIVKKAIEMAERSIGTQ
jgi:small acid-soluble spore protein F (minor alpha/beta-type SASP)